MNNIHCNNRKNTLSSVSENCQESNEAMTNKSTLTSGKIQKEHFHEKKIINYYNYFHSHFFSFQRSLSLFSLFPFFFLPFFTWTNYVGIVGQGKNCHIIKLLWLQMFAVIWTKFSFCRVFSRLKNIF